ncbi:MAG: TonB-dependent receptor [Tannerellaceae bacterium]|nr:TonB-dependent receptor [Tannerellaceae bacterium]
MKQITGTGRLWLITLLAVNLFSFTLRAQTGVICGTITDAKYKEPLIGASVVIEGTSTGAITDINGYFRIEGLKPGNYTILVSYVSYQTQTVNDIPVIARQEAVVNIQLSDADLQLQNVVVVAQRKLGTEMAVLNTVRTSLPVVSGISSQQISKTQDNDAAEVLRRILGITIVDERFVVVRGLAQRYNGVWLNNATTPSSETDSRAFSFDVPPSSLIDNMMVYKSPSAELPADFSGGFVKVLTKNIPEGNTFHIAYQMGFNTNASFRSFQLTEGSAADYFGFGASSRMLPANTPAHLNDVSTADAVAFTRQVNDRWKINHFTAIPEQKLTLTMNRVFDLGNIRIGNVSSINYSTGYDYYESVNRNYISYDMINDRSSYRYDYDDVQYKNTTKLGALFNWSLLAGKNKYEFRNFFSQRGTSSLTQREGTDYYSEEYIRKWESLYTARTTYSGQVSGEHTFREDINKLDWTAGYAFAGYNEPDRKVVKSNLETRGGEEQFMVSSPSRYYQQLKDHSFSLAVNYEHAFHLSEQFRPSLQVGAYGEKKNRTFDGRRFLYNLLGSGYNRYADWDYTEVFAEENLAADRIYIKEATNKSDAYTSDNLTGAGYMALKLNWGGLSSTPM